MPIIASAKKKMRQDVKRTEVNQKVRDSVYQAVKSMRLEPTVEHLKHVYRVVDTAAKKAVIPVNRAARLKSRLSRLLTKESLRNTVKTTVKSSKKPRRMSIPKSAILSV